MKYQLSCRNTVKKTTFTIIFLTLTKWKHGKNEYVDYMCIGPGNQINTNLKINKEKSPNALYPYLQTYNWKYRLALLITTMK